MLCRAQSASHGIQLIFLLLKGELTLYITHFISLFKSILRFYATDFSPWLDIIKKDSGFLTIESRYLFMEAAFYIPIYTAAAVNSTLKVKITVTSGITKRNHLEKGTRPISSAKSSPPKKGVKNLVMPSPNWKANTAV